MQVGKLAMPVAEISVDTAAAISLLGASSAGIRVSTTHTIAGAIMGAGSVQRLTAVRWGVATKIVWAWVLTIPAAALVSSLCFFLLRCFFPGA